MYPKSYFRKNRFGTENRSLFDLCYREWINSNKNQPTAASMTVSSVAATTTASAKKTETTKNTEITNDGL